MGETILVTGFEPFGGERTNPAWEAVQLLPDRIGGASVAKREIPVVFGGAAAAVRQAIEETDPALVLCVGQAGGRSALSFEFLGINYADARIPDNAGACPVGVPVVPGGPDAYFSTLPVKAMAEGAKAAGVPAEVSYTAGTYVCNETLYALLHYLATSRAAVRGGFAHVPYTPAQASLHPGMPSMEGRCAARGLAAALEAALACTHDIERSAGRIC